MSAHTSFRQGTHVFVQLKNGDSFDDIFVERKSTYIVLRERGRIPKDDLRAVSVRRHQTERPRTSR